MTQYQPYPGGAATPPPVVQPDPPPSILNAVKCMYAGAVLSGVYLIVGLVSISAIKAAIRHALPHASAATINSDMRAAVVDAVLSGAIGIGLWLWMAAMNRRGRNWARILSTVFFALDTLGVLLGFGQHTPVLTKLLSILVWLAGLGAMIFMWQAVSTAYYRAAR
jgi:TRAP-type mannitol/chloroaromatic compound transport system permease small subunit